MFENGRPRYWIPGYDRWNLIFPVALGVVLVARLWLPEAVMERAAVAVLGRRMDLFHERPAPAPPPRPMAPTRLDSPQNGKGFFQARMADAAGRAEPGALVALEYARMDPRDPEWHVLSQMPADGLGMFRFQLQNFPPGNYRLRARATADAGRMALSGEVMVSVLPDPAREGRRRTRK